MKKNSLRLLTLVLCVFFTVLIVPQVTLAASVPSAPTDLTASAESSSEIYLDWDSVTDAASYYIYRATSSSGTYSKIATTTTSRYTDSDLRSETTYYYKVVSVNSAGTTSAYSSRTSETTLDSDDDDEDNSLSAPKDLTATAESSSEIYLDWDSVSAATSYYVYRSKTSSGTYSKIGTATSSKYTDSDLKSDTTYYYKVKTVKNSKTSDFSSKDYAKTLDSDDEDDEDEDDSLSAPKDLTATAESSSKIYLDWDSVSSATSYYVYRSTTSSGTYSKIGTATSSKYTDSDLKSNTTYYYKVKTVKNSKTSGFSSKDHAKTLDSDEDDDEDEDDSLSVPKDLTATAESSSEIYLDWDSVSAATSYYVYRSTTSSGTYSKIGTATSSKYTDSDLKSDTTYYYKVKTVKNSKTSGFSSKDHAKTLDSDEDDDDDESDSLSAPTDFSAKEVSSSEIYLDWDSVRDAKSYYVYRSTTSSGTYSKISTTSTSSYTDKDLESDTTYYYKVRAVNSSGKSEYSSKKSATTSESDESDLSKPTDLTAKTESSSKIYLDWDSVSEATSYYVYSSTTSSGTYSKISTTTSSDYTDTGLSPNTTYYYKVTAVNGWSSSGYSSSAYATTAKTDGTIPTEPSSDIHSDRLAGEDMYGTSAEVAKSGWTTSYYAVIVSGENFTDALCSAPLAQKYNAPLLLTTKNTLHEQTKAQLERLKVKKVIIIGGAGIISSGVEQSIKDLGIGVTRIAGTDKYDTSIKIAQAIGEFDQAVIASGETFPDALSIAPIAAMKGMPILLTPKDKLPANIEGFLEKNVRSTYVVGGTGIISDNVLKQLPSPRRLSGNTRYDTNISIIKEFADQLDFSTCYVSTGENYADALSGAALASITNSPVFLVSDPVDPVTINFFKSKIRSIKKEVIFGGIAVVPNSILINIDEEDYDDYDTPAAPTGLEVTAVSSSQINLTWDSVNDATSYYVYGATSSSGTYSHIATVSTTSYTNTGLWADTTYYYKVRAVNSTGSSPDSAMDYAKTDLPD